MSIRLLRNILTYLTVVLVTMTAVLLYQRYLQEKNTREVGEEIIRLCKLPEVPEEIIVRHAVIDRSEDPRFVDVLLTLTGPENKLNDWLDGFDEWEKKRLGVIENHRTRESEGSSRFDFTAEVYVE
ncbi:MAG: hypothetical protein PVJ98_11505 [Akkermansiaceae bacterium]|jgi:hypothetical protein